MDIPHYYSDGYKAYGNWPGITFSGVYNNTDCLPYELSNNRKQCTTVALFIIGIYRGKMIGGKCLFRFTMYYDHSIN